jgi:hypothetical protein
VTISFFGSKPITVHLNGDQPSVSIPECPVDVQVKPTGKLKLLVNAQSGLRLVLFSGTLFTTNGRASMVNTGIAASGLWTAG